MADKEKGKRNLDALPAAQYANEQAKLLNSVLDSDLSPAELGSLADLGKQLIHLDQQAYHYQGILEQNSEVIIGGLTCVIIGLMMLAGSHSDVDRHFGTAVFLVGLGISLWTRYSNHQARPKKALVHAEFAEVRSEIDEYIPAETDLATQISVEGIFPVINVIIMAAAMSKPDTEEKEKPKNEDEELVELPLTTTGLDKNSGLESGSSS